MGGGWVNRPLAIWHGATRDGAKRQMLKAAISHLEPIETENRPKLVEEVLWILDVAQKLEGLRDDSAHTPLHASTEQNLYTIGNLLHFGSTLIFPNTGFQNPRAMRLNQGSRNLLIDYRYARERIVILRDYAIAIDAAWSNASLPWPDRPALPDRNSIQRSKGRASHRKKK
jgi:hypothetical protein